MAIAVGTSKDRVGRIARKKDGYSLYPTEGRKYLQKFILLLKTVTYRFRKNDIYTFAASFQGELEKGRYSNVYVPQRLGKIALNLCLFAALVFFFTWKLPATGSHTNHILKGSQYAGLSVSLSDGIGNFFRTPLNHPKETGPVLANITEPESEDDLQIEGFEFAWQMAYFVSTPHHLLLDKILSAFPSLFFLNRGTVPLFVLHHSWKNFPHSNLWAF